MNIHYFFITDHVKFEDLKIRYCPTTDMVADHFAKPLPENAFLNFGP